MTALKWIWKTLFILSTKFFLFSRYLNFCISIFTLFSPMGYGFRQWWKINLKGYLHYKTILLKQCHLRHSLRIFLFPKIVQTSKQKYFYIQTSKKIFLYSYFFFSRYSNFCIFNHFMIYQICEIVSISPWNRVQFWIQLLNHNSLSH